MLNIDNPCNRSFGECIITPKSYDLQSNLVLVQKRSYENTALENCRCCEHVNFLMLCAVLFMLGMCCSLYKHLISNMNMSVCLSVVACPFPEMFAIWKHHHWGVVKFMPIFGTRGLWDEGSLLWQGARASICSVLSNFSTFWY